MTIAVTVADNNNWQMQPEPLEVASELYSSDVSTSSDSSVAATSPVISSHKVACKENEPQSRTNGQSSSTTTHFDIEKISPQVQLRQSHSHSATKHVMIEGDNLYGTRGSGPVHSGDIDNSPGESPNNLTRSSNGSVLAASNFTRSPMHSLASVIEDNSGLPTSEKGTTNESILNRVHLVIPKIPVRPENTAQNLNVYNISADQCLGADGAGRVTSDFSTFVNLCAETVPFESATPALNPFLLRTERPNALSGTGMCVSRTSMDTDRSVSADGEAATAAPVQTLPRRASPSTCSSVIHLAESHAASASVAQTRSSTNPVPVAMSVPAAASLKTSTSSCSQNTRVTPHHNQNTSVNTVAGPPQRALVTRPTGYSAKMLARASTQVGAVCSDVHVPKHTINPPALAFHHSSPYIMSKSTISVVAETNFVVEGPRANSKEPFNVCTTDSNVDNEAPLVSHLTPCTLR